MQRSFDADCWLTQALEQRSASVTRQKGHLLLKQGSTFTSAARVATDDSGLQDQRLTSCILRRPPDTQINHRKEVSSVELQSYVATLAPNAALAAAKVPGPVGDVIRAGISERPVPGCHDYHHDHGGYDHTRSGK